jgi:hypothetical protein
MQHAAKITVYQSLNGYGIVSRIELIICMKLVFVLQQIIQ